MNKATLKTPDEWQIELPDEIILDADGWQGSEGRPWEDPITKEEFLLRRGHCTCRSNPEGRTDLFKPIHSAQHTKSMKPVQPSILTELERWGEIAMDNESDFLQRFCINGQQLVTLAWNDETMQFTYVLTSGEHVGDSAPVQGWLDFLRTHG